MFPAAVVGKAALLGHKGAPALCCSLAPLITAACLITRCCALSARSSPGAQSWDRPAMEEGVADAVCPSPLQLP